MSNGLHLLEFVTARQIDPGVTYALQLSVGLAARGHRVVVGGLPGSAPIEAARAAGLPVLEAFDFRMAPLPAPGMLLRLRRYLSESRFDLVNAHRRADHLSLALGLGPHRPARLVRTHSDLPPPGRHPLRHLLHRRDADAHILVAGFMRLGWRAVLRPDPGRLAVIPPGIDPDAFRRGAPDRWAARELLGLPPRARLVGLVGRFDLDRGHLVALEAFGRVARTSPDVRFVLTGAAGEIPPENLRSRAAELGAGAAVLVLPCPPDARTLMAALDIGVVASTASEVICRAAMEFLALGVPVVGSNLHSIPEIVPHGVAGLIVPPGDPEALAAALSRLLADPALRERLGDAGPARVRQAHSLERCLDATEGLYRHLIRQHR